MILYRTTQIFFLVLLTFNACSKPEPSHADKTIATGDDKNFFRILDGSNLVLEESGLTGNGSVIAKKPLLGSDSSLHLKFSFQLKPDSSLEIVTFCNKQLEQGISILINRMDSRLIKFTINHSYEKIMAIDELYSYTDHNSNLFYSLELDIHNNEKPPHILMWKSDLKIFNDENAFFDSSLENLNINNGQGYFWGIIIREGIMHTPIISGAKYEH